MTQLRPIDDLDGHGRYERQMLEQLKPICGICKKPVAGWLEPDNAKLWLDIHWRKKHTDE